MVWQTGWIYVVKIALVWHDSSKGYYVVQRRRQQSWIFSGSFIELDLAHWLNIARPIFCFTSSKSLSGFYSVGDSVANQLEMALLISWRWCCSSVGYGVAHQLEMMLLISWRWCCSSVGDSIAHQLEMVLLFSWR